jgi:hypothetical protein
MLAAIVVRHRHGASGRRRLDRALIFARQETFSRTRGFEKQDRTKEPKSAGAVKEFLTNRSATMFRFAQRTCVFALAAAGVFAQVVTTPAVTTTTGMIGVAGGQMARLNVLNPGDRPNVVPPPAGVYCSAVVEFLDGGGKVLKSTTVNVSPGQATPFDLFSDSDLNLALTERTEIRAIIMPPAVIPVVSTSTAPLQPTVCTLIGTLEIIDSLTNRTQAVLGGMHDVPAAPAVTTSSSQ